ncbi:MAG TPA: HD domain-containing phosphohydrolase [Acidobacteriota bacterium]|nr:HD domain-containing phosphohydrolase [Acidobacteriota bacterium]
MRATVLVVDDEPSICQLLRDWLTEELDLWVEAVTTRLEAERILELRPVDLLLADLRLQECSGLDVIRYAQSLQPHIVPILMTGYPTLETAITAVQSGIYDYLTKPFKMELLSAAVRRGIDRCRLRRENMELREQLAVSDLTRTVGATLELDQILEAVLNTVMAEFNATAASVLLLNEETGRLELKGVEGDPTTIENSVFSGFLGGVAPTAASVMATRRPALLTDRQGELFPRLSVHQDRICQPLVVKGRAVGALNIVRRSNAEPCGDGTLRTIDMIAAHAAIAIDNARLYKNLHSAYMDTVSALANAIEIRDPYTRGHTDRVRMLARGIGQRLGWSAEKQFDLWMGCTLHDIGKIGVPDSILSKPGPLTADEFALMKTHPEIGAKIIEGVPFLKPAIPYVYHHHERFDGSGYPTGISGEQIPIEGRILAVVDAFDAITSDRPYRKGQPVAVAVEELKGYSGVQFDAAIVDVFFSFLEDKDPPWLRKRETADYVHVTASA